MINHILKYWTALLVALANFFVRSYRMTEFGLNSDEPFTVYFAQWSLDGIYTVLMSGNNPPLFEFCLHYWMSLFGTSLFALRLLPLLLVSAASFLLHLIAERHSNYSAWLVSSLFLSSNLLLLCSHTVRAYSLLVFTSVATIFFVLYGLNSRFSFRLNGSFFVLVVLLSALPFIHFYGWLILFSVLIYSLLNKNKNLVLASVMSFTCSLPLLMHTIQRALNTIDMGTSLDYNFGFSTIRNVLLDIHNGVPTYAIIGSFIIFVLPLIRINQLSETKNYLRATMLKAVIGLTIASWLLIASPWLGINLYDDFYPEVGLIALLLLFTPAIFYSKFSGEGKMSFPNINILLLGPLFIFLSFSLFFPLYAQRYVVIFIPFWFLSMVFILVDFMRWSALKKWNIFTANLMIAKVVVLLILVWQSVSGFTLSGKVYAPLESMNEMMTNHDLINAHQIWMPGYCDLLFAWHLKRQVFFQAPLHELTASKIREGNFKEPLHNALNLKYVYVLDVGADPKGLTVPLSSSDTICFCDCGTWRYPETQAIKLLKGERRNHFIDFSSEGGINLDCYSK
jgi:hypothetical protein